VGAVLAVGCAAAAGAGAACDAADTAGEAPRESAGKELSASDDLPAKPRWNDVVGGVEQIRDDNGTVLATKVFPPDPTVLEAAESVAARSAGGQRTSSRIVPVQGVTYDGGTLRSYSYVRSVSPSLAKGQGSKQPPPSEAPPAEPPVLSPALQAAMSGAGAGAEIPVIVAVRTEPSSSLAAPVPVVELATGAASEGGTELTSRINARREEVALLHGPLRTRLAKLWGTSSKLVSFWLNGRLGGRLTPSEIYDLSTDAEVARITLDLPSPGAVANTWDGTNVSNGGTDGLNAGKYRTGGYYGDGHGLRLGFAGDGFYFNHAIFKDSEGGPSRYLYNWNCASGSCSIITQPLGGIHETLVSSAAAGDATQGQVPGVSYPGDRLDRTGVAPEADLFSAEATNLSSVTAALQKMIEYGVDIFNVARGDGVTPTACDYNIWELDWSATVKNAHDAGVMVVSSAGNSAGAGCSVTPWAEATSAFVVGGTLDPPDNGYSNAARNPAWSTGPMNAYVYGTAGTWVFRTSVLSAVTAVTPGSWRFGASTPDNFQQTGGTSLAAPQIAGAAMLVKDAFLSAGLTYINSPGVAYAALLAMTDRSQGAGFRTAGFDPGYGGGRFQLRYFGGSSDHPAGGAWGFDLWEVTIHNNEIIDFPVRGTAAEPSTIQQFKVYAVVFEQDWRTVADVDLYVLDQNCAGSTLGYDTSFDTKSMVRLGAESAGKALCVRVKGYAVPPAGRRVVLASYFSVDTSMR